jgi:hypothetical protein
MFDRVLLLLPREPSRVVTREHRAQVLGAILEASESERAVRKSGAALVLDDHAEMTSEAPDHLERRQLPHQIHVGDESGCNQHVGPFAEDGVGDVDAVAGARVEDVGGGSAIAQEPTGATASCTIPTRGVSSASNGRCWLNMRPERLLTNQPSGAVLRTPLGSRAGGAATARVR